MSLPDRSFRSRFRFAALAVGLACAVGATLASATVELQSGPQGAQLRFDAQLDASSAARLFYLEISSDLQDWASYQVFRYSGEDGWRIDESPDGVEIVAQTETGEEVWTIGFAISAEDAVFARVLSQMVEGPLPADPTVTAETRALLRNLHRIGWDDTQFMFGQEFPLTYRVTDGAGNDDLEQSDVKDVVGDHPGVHGSDFIYIMEKPWEAAYHISAAKKAYADGAVVTFDFHWSGKYGHSYRNHPEDDKILYNVVNGDDSRGDVTWFYQQLDVVLDLLNEDLQIPIVFRPFHEMDGNWFWWGRQMPGGAATYRAAYQKVVEYMRARTQYVLFCWSPDVALPNFQQFYPGDAYVDMVGRDIYSVGNSGRGFEKLTEMIDFAEERGKVASFTETGFTAGGTSFEVGDPDWWTTRVLEPMLVNGEAMNVAWVLTWINAEWSGPYVPHGDSPQAAKADFIEFYQSPATLFQAEVAALKMYE